MCITRVVLFMLQYLSTCIVHFYCFYMLCPVLSLLLSFSRFSFHVATTFQPLSVLINLIYTQEISLNIFAKAEVRRTMRNWFQGGSKFPDTVLSTGDFLTRKWRISWVLSIRKQNWYFNGCGVFRLAEVMTNAGARSDIICVFTGRRLGSEPLLHGAYRAHHVLCRMSKSRMIFKIRRASFMFLWSSWAYD